jgi:histidinol-phosphate aminotransferase
MKRATHIDQLVRPLIRDLKPYSSARDEYADSSAGMIFLDANENPYERGVNRYPDPHQRGLKRRIAEIRGVTTDQLLLGNGSDEVLDLLIRVFCEPYKDAIISLPPTYGMYRVLAGINAVENIEIPLTEDFEADVETILDNSGDRTKILFLCSPNNPTGNSLKRTDVIRLLEEFPGMVVVDEAYIDFSSAEGYVPELNKYPNLVVTQTLSKAFGMAGIRLGICLAHPEVVNYMKRVKPPYNVNELTQQRAFAAIEDLNRTRKEISALIKGREQLAEGLSRIAFVKKVFPSDANFVLARVDDAETRYRQLLERGIVVRDRSSQHLCENTLRFTVGTPEEIQGLLQTLEELNESI